MKIKDIYFVKLLIYIYKRFFEKHPLLLLLIIALLLNTTSWILASFKGRPENYIIPLHYLLIKGVDRTGPWYYIYQIPLAGLVIMVVNFYIAFNFEKDKKISYLLASATIFLEIFFIIAGALIVFKT